MMRSLPEGLWVLSSASRLVGMDDPIEMLKDFKQLIDTDALRRIGTEVWGTSTGRSSTGGHLDDLGKELTDTFFRTVENRWQGDAYEAFERYISGIRSALFQEADRLPTIGDVLIHVADGIELTWLEMIGTGLATASLVLSARSMTTIVGFIAGFIEAMLSLIGLAVGVVAIATPRIKLLSEQESILNRNTFARGDSAIFELPGITGSHRGWTPKSADPFS